MTYFPDAARAIATSPFPAHETCPGCGEPASGPTVAHDLHLDAHGKFSRVMFHRDCAFALAQRIICDAWPNRRDEPAMMKTER